MKAFADLKHDRISWLNEFSFAHRFSCQFMTPIHKLAAGQINHIPESTDI